MERAKAIKSVASKRYELTLFELASGQYVIGYSKLGEDEPTLSENIKDFDIASKLFDMKLLELEGH